MNFSFKLTLNKHLNAGLITKILRSKTKFNSLGSLNTLSKHANKIIQLLEDRTFLDVPIIKLYEKIFFFNNQVKIVVEFCKQPTQLPLKRQARMNIFWSWGVVFRFDVSFPFEMNLSCMELNIFFSNLPLI